MPAALPGKASPGNLVERLRGQHPPPRYWGDTLAQGFALTEHYRAHVAQWAHAGYGAPRTVSIFILSPREGLAAWCAP